MGQIAGRIAGIIKKGGTSPLHFFQLQDYQ